MKGDAVKGVVSPVPALCGVVRSWHDCYRPITINSCHRRQSMLVSYGADGLVCVTQVHQDEQSPAGRWRAGRITQA